VGCSVLQCVTVCCSVLQCVVACCSVSQTELLRDMLRSAGGWYQYVVVGVAVCCSVLRVD